MALMLRLAPFAVIALMAGYIQILRAQAETLEANLVVERGNVAALETAVADQAGRIEQLVVDQAAAQTSIRFLSDEKRKAEEARDREVAALNQWRNKLASEIQNRPKVVARAAGLAFRRVLLDIEAVTADRDQDGGSSGAAVSSGASGTADSATD